MKPHRPHFATSFLVALGIGTLAAAGCSRAETPAQNAPAQGSSTAAATVPVSALPKIDQQAILQHIKVLSADDFEGRAPGTAGEDKTVEYLTSQFKQLGLQPGNTDGTYTQAVPLVGLTPTATQPLTITGGAQKGRKTYKWSEDYVAFTKHVADTAGLQNSELVFVGYGVVAPEYKWDDFKGMDLKGKTIVVLVNDPQVPDAADASKLDQKMFNGNAMTYYGRWTYKYEEAARQGAAGVFIVHETGPAGYPYSVVQGFLGERFDLVTPDKNMGRSDIEGWFSLETAKEILTLAGHDFDALKKQAITRDFKPVPLGLSASIGIRNAMRTVQSRNVLARLEGSDPELKDEYVVFSSHWDHLGVGEPVNGDKIYNGALDNASGVASLLEIARAFTQLEQKPKRSVLFLMVTAEEQGLLGSQYYSVTPVYPLEKTLANINIDGVNQWGRTKDITVIGMGASDLDDYLRAAATEQGRTLRPEPEAEKGFYYRSDHFNFAKEGVPALYTDSGTEFIGKDPEYAKQKRDEYTAKDYHAPSDEIKPDWDLSGAVEDAQLMMAVALRVANADKFPEWKPGNEFKAKRDERLKK
jgi:Zn-dependent M28 family amino/carboxypeptidase